MKNKLIGGWILAATVTVVCLAGAVASGQAQPAAPDTVAALPPNIAPDSPVAQVVKLVQAGVEVGVIKTFIANSASAFNLDAEKIITLTDLGVPTELVNAMMEHDKNFSGATTAVPPAPTSGEDNSYVAAPTTQVDVQYFNNTLSPYGSWVVVEGYGRCWRPTTVIYDSTWQPYCDRGHWVYSDCGWYWDSDYSWGATFHYGRWFRNDRFGWCWWPDTVWAPSWVTWRQSDAYCGWAPLPPFAIYRPGFGFSYRGAGVAVGFDFGLSAGCFTFVPVERFCERHPRYYRAEEGRREELFHRTTVINNYHDDRTMIINGGISVDHIRGATHQPIQPVAVGELPNASRHGWRGGNADLPGRRSGHDALDNNAARNAPGEPLRHGPVLRDDHMPEANVNHRQGIGQPNAVPNRSENINPPTRPQSPEQPGNRNGQRERELNNRNASPSAQSQPNLTPPANNNPVPGAPFTRNQPQRLTPPVAGGTPERIPPQSNLPPGGNERMQSPNNHNQQQPQFTPANNVPVRSTPPNDWRPNRAAEAPVISAPPPRAVPQIEQRQFAPPSAPSAPDRFQQREQRIEQRQNSVEAAPRNVTPPPVQSQAPAQNQSRSSNPNSDRGSERDKQNH